MDDFRDDPIEGIRVRPGMTVDDLVRQLGHGGINASSVARAADIIETMIEDEDCTVLLSVAGPMVPGGLRQLISGLIEAGWVDALITTGATLTHDTIETLGGHHHHGSEHPIEPGQSHRDYDEQLREASIDRIYNVYLPQEHFATFEAHLWEHVLPSLHGDPVSIAELTAALGEANAAVADGDAGGIAATAYEHDVPVFCPAVQDSILGLQAWLYSRTHDFSIDALRDMTDLTEIAARGERSGAILVAGGVPKNFTLQTKLVTPGAYDFAVQFTMDPEATGGLSGASLDEARSWGKLDPDAQNETVFGDALITVPLTFAAVFDRLE